LGSGEQSRGFALPTPTAVCPSTARGQVKLASQTENRNLSVRPSGLFVLRATRALSGTKAQQVSILYKLNLRQRQRISDLHRNQFISIIRHVGQRRGAPIPSREHRRKKVSSGGSRIAADLTTLAVLQRLVPNHICLLSKLVPLHTLYWFTVCWPKLIFRLFCFFRNCLRRIARHDEQQFSKDSIVNVMEKFVKTVNIMDDTILVPCRLMDRQVGT